MLTPCQRQVGPTPLFRHHPARARLVETFPWAEMALSSRTHLRLLGASLEGDRVKQERRGDDGNHPWTKPRGQVNDTNSDGDPVRNLTNNLQARGSEDTSMERSRGRHHDHREGPAGRSASTQQAHRSSESEDRPTSSGGDAGGYRVANGKAEQVGAHIPLASFLSPRT